MSQGIRAARVDYVVRKVPLRFGMYAIAGM